MFTAYGFAPKPDLLNPLLTTRKRKPIYYNNWAERNGAEWDLDAPVKYEDRQINIQGYIKSTSLADFQTKFAALKTAFANTGYQTISSVELGTTYDVKCYLLGITGVNVINENYTELTLELQEVQDA